MTEYFCFGIGSSSEGKELIQRDFPRRTCHFGVLLWCALKLSREHVGIQIYKLYPQEYHLVENEIQVCMALSHISDSETNWELFFPEIRRIKSESYISRELPLTPWSTQETVPMWKIGEGHLGITRLWKGKKPGWSSLVLDWLHYLSQHPGQESRRLTPLVTMFNFWGTKQQAPPKYPHQIDGIIWIIVQGNEAICYDLHHMGINIKAKLRNRTSTENNNCILWILNSIPEEKITTRLWKTKSNFYKSISK